MMSTFTDRDEQEGSREFAKVLTGINQSSPVTEHGVSEARNEYGSLFIRELVARQCSTRFGVVSFSEGLFNPLMWSHYTIDGSGFVIGYNTRELRVLSMAWEHATSSAPAP